VDTRRRRPSAKGAARGPRHRRAAPRPARLAVRLVRDRHRRTTLVGPYAVVTAEVLPGRYETSVTWGKAGRRSAASSAPSPSCAPPLTSITRTHAGRPNRTSAPPGARRRRRRRPESPSGAEATGTSRHAWPRKGHEWLTCPAPPKTGQPGSAERNEQMNHPYPRKASC
jgi:hypothetical protein